MYIRQATKDDAEVLVSAQQQTAATEEGLLAPRPHEITAEALRSKIQSLQDNGVFLILEDEEKPIGHLLLEPVNLEATRHVARLTLVIHPGYTGKGCGHKLLSHAINWARESAKVEKIELNVRPHNTPAIKLYQSLGFEVEGVHRERIKLTNGYMDNISMALFVRKPTA